MQKRRKKNRESKEITKDKESTFSWMRVYRVSDGVLVKLAGTDKETKVRRERESEIVTEGFKGKRISEGKTEVF